MTYGESVARGGKCLVVISILMVFFFGVAIGFFAWLLIGGVFLVPVGEYLQSREERRSKKP